MDKYKVMINPRAIRELDNIYRNSPDRALNRYGFCFPSGAAYFIDSSDVPKAVR